MHLCDSDSDGDCEFYDSDYNVENGDDEPFFDYVNSSLSDYNEK
jgi:hypothetical protein